MYQMYLVTMVYYFIDCFNKQKWTGAERGSTGAKRGCRDLFIGDRTVRQVEVRWLSGQGIRLVIRRLSV